MINRRKTRQIQLGNVKVGGGAPITVQSMTKTDTRDVQATLLEIWSLEAAGCDIVRCAVPVREAAQQLGLVLLLLLMVFAIYNDLVRIDAFKFFK